MLIRSKNCPLDGKVELGKYDGSAFSILDQAFRAIDKKTVVPLAVYDPSSGNLIVSILIGTGYLTTEVDPESAMSGSAVDEIPVLLTECVRHRTRKALTLEEPKDSDFTDAGRQREMEKSAPSYEIKTYGKLRVSDADERRNDMEAVE